MKQAPFGLLACEPNWVYPLCNTIGAAGLAALDNQLGTRHWAGVEPRFREAFDSEFLSPDGRIIPCRSEYLGLAFPMVGGAVGQAFPAYFLNATLPDLALRHWLTTRRTLQDPGARRRSLWAIDVGNYRFSRASSYAATAAAARELGDGEIASALLVELDSECPPSVFGGVLHRPNASLWAHAAEGLARFGRRDSLRRMVEPDGSASLGPCLADAPYADVMVAKAKDTGGALRAVLYPAHSPKHTTLQLSGLRPSGHYRIEGQPEFVADAAGKAAATVYVSGRTEIFIHPVE